MLGLTSSFLFFLFAYNNLRMLEKDQNKRAGSKELLISLEKML